MALQMDDFDSHAPSRLDTGVRRRAEETGARVRSLSLDLQRLQASLTRRRASTARAVRDELDEIIVALDALDPAARTEVERAVAPVRRALRGLTSEEPPSARAMRDLRVLTAHLRCVIGHCAEGVQDGSRPSPSPRVRYTQCDASSMLQASLPPFHALAAQRGVHFDAEVPRRLHAEVDTDHFLHTFLSLLVDAFAHAECGGRVHARVRSRGHDLEIAVTDPGAASRRLVAPAALGPRAFAAFDLGAAAERLHLHGGALTVARSASGGCEVRARIPRRAPENVEVTLVGAIPLGTTEHVERALGALLTPGHDDPENAQRLAVCAERTKRNFLGMVSHELKTPVTAMRLHLRMLEREAGPTLTPAVQQRLARIHRSKQQLLYLVETMLECSLHQGGRFIPHVRSIDPRRLLEGIVEELRPAGATVRLRIESPSQWGGPDLTSDERVLRLILLQLVTHALHRGGDGPVSLDVDGRDGWHRFAITHAGPSFSELERRELLAPLEVDLDLRARVGSGSGLGFYLVRDLARAIEGSVAVLLPRTVEISVPSLEVGLS